VPRRIHTFLVFGEFMPGRIHSRRFMPLLYLENSYRGEFILRLHLENSYLGEFMPLLYLENSYPGEFIPFFDAHDKDFY